MLRWNPVPGAVSYTVDMLCGTGQSCTDGTRITTTAHTMMRFTGLGDIGWHVQANFPNGTTTGQPSDWSPTQTYTHTIPAPANPATLRTTTGALFSWDPLAGATSYKVEIFRVNSFATLIGTSFFTENTSWAPTLATTDYLNGGTFYWRVSAKDGDGQHRRADRGAVDDDALEAERHGLAEHPAARQDDVGHGDREVVRQPSGRRRQGRIRGRRTTVVATS